MDKLSVEERESIKNIRETYSITIEEEEEILTHLGTEELWKTIACTLSLIQGLDAISEEKNTLSQDNDLVTLSSEQRVFYEQAFKKFDKDGDKLLSFDELQALLRAVGRSDSGKKVDKLMATIDEKISQNCFTFEVFINFIQKGLSDKTESPTKQYFDFFDVDQSGTVSVEELRLCLNDLDLGLSETEIEQMLQSVFQNSDQELSYEEFSQKFTQIAPVNLR